MNESGGTRGASAPGLADDSAPRPRWAEGIDKPRWLALREGAAPLVVVAPHGGRRARPIRRGDSVNDLHSAEIAWELAARTDAHAIVNFDLDRNEIDLNRISHLATRAPFVLELLLAAIRAAAEGGRRPLVLFVHGWNMVVPCCDIGIGLKRSGGVLHGRHPTLGEDGYSGPVARIEKELEARGLSAAIGRRYTASGRDNAAQLFSGRHATHENALVGALGLLSLEGRVDAAQLELGIPLRWPGWRREALIDALAAALSDESATLMTESRSPMTATARAWIAPREHEAGEAPPLERGYALQAVLDTDGNYAIFCGVEATGPRSMAARFSIVCADGTMMLLVGEGGWSGEAGRYELETLRWSADADGRVEISIRGPLIRYPTHDAYLDLETGLAGSELVEGEIDLVFEPRSEEHGLLRGRIRCDGLDLEVATTAFCDRGGRRGGAQENRLRVAVARDDAEALLLREALSLEGNEGLGVIRREGSSELGDGALCEAQIIARVPVWRPLGEGVFARWTFGIVRCRFENAGEAPGLFESLEIFDLARKD